MTHTSRLDRGTARGGAGFLTSVLRNMREVFWISLVLIIYAYVGYPLLLFAYARWNVRTVEKAEMLPTVSIIMAARNEAQNLQRKLENLRDLDYPQSRVQVVVASDGSRDNTEAILREQGDQVTAVVLERSVGKALALNAAVQRATGEILVFLDVRQVVDRAALRELTANFADLQIGAVSGELLLEDGNGIPAADALGLYWRIEKMVRRFESASGSVVGVTGAIYAVRRELFHYLPPRLILDDVLVPMRVAQAGRRVIFEPKAIARDVIFTDPGKEFGRKVRTLTGNYQLVKFAPWIVSGKNPLLFRFVSHKLMRLMVPVLLLLCFISSLFASGMFYKGLFLVQVGLYLLALLGNFLPLSKKFKLVGVTTTFVMLNAAAALAFYNFVVGKDEVWA